MRPRRPHNFFDEPSLADLILADAPPAIDWGWANEAGRAIVVARSRRDDYGAGARSLTRVEI